MRVSVMKGYAQKAVCGVSALALACGIAAFPAAGGVNQAYAADSVSVDGYITAASYRAAEPAPEILGLTNLGTNTAWQQVGQLAWNAPYYYIFGTAEYNSNPNPYMVNAVNDGTPSMTYYDRGGGPTGYMPAIGAIKEDTQKPYDGIDEVWLMAPDVILGTTNGRSEVDYLSDDYAETRSAVESANNMATGSYKPIGVKYDSTDVYTMIDSMYSLAAAADKADAADSSKTLRYGNATAIAQQYETYVRGTLGYVLNQLEANGAEKKTVALVRTYDAESNTYQIIPTGVAEGTATANRYLEAVQPVAVNIADDGRETVTTGSGRNATTYATATPDELAKADLILLGSQAGSEIISSTEDILGTFTQEELAKTFWVGSSISSAGSMYGTVMNSVENAQNIGRIVGCLYPEYINQANWIAYYYDNFYHIANGKLAEAIDNAMDGVRNYNASNTSDVSSMTLWTQSDVANYVESDVQLALDQGIAYLKANAGSVPSYLAPTDNIGDDATPAMHRLYNPYSGEHFYTASTSEYENLVSLGWNDENIGWVAPAYSATPVYRLYNSFGGEHHYTMSAEERDNLVKAGWNDEGIGWYSDDAKTVALLREYNPNEFANNHNYTTSEEEHTHLVSLGWRDEGTAWFAVAGPESADSGSDLVPVTL